MSKKKTIAVPLWKRLLLRFIRGFMASFVPAFTTFAAMSPDKWTGSLLLSVFIGGLAGGLQVIDKYLRERVN